MFEHGRENAQEPRDSGIGRDRVAKRHCNPQSSYARQYVRGMSESAKASEFRPVMQLRHARYAKETLAVLEGVQWSRVSLEFGVRLTARLRATGRNHA